MVLEDPRVWITLHRVPLDESAPRSPVRFVSVPDRSARLLIHAARDLRSSRDDESPPERIVIWGTGPTVFHLAVGVLRSGFVGGANPEIVLCGEDAEDNLRTLEELEPWMSSKVRITIGSSRPECWRGARLAFVCEEGEAEGIGTASTLRRWISEAAPILVAVPDADAATALRAAGVGLDNTSLISISESLYGRRWLTDWAFDELARARARALPAKRTRKGRHA